MVCNSLESITPIEFSCWEEVDGEKSYRDYYLDIDCESSELIVLDECGNWIAIFNLNRNCHGALCNALNDNYGFTLFLKEE